MARGARRLAGFELGVDGRRERLVVEVPVGGTVSVGG